MPYEQLKQDKLQGYKIGYEETTEYGEVEIREEFDKVLISIMGHDDCGFFTAASCCSVEEFMNGDDRFLDRMIGSILFYCKQYDEEE